jgi:hypothetical protein
MPKREVLKGWHCGPGSSLACSTFDCVSGSSDSTIHQLEDELAVVERTLSGMGALSEQQAKRVAERMDRLASQLLELSSPPPIGSVHERLGTEPAGAEELEGLADWMAPADGEG